MTEEEAKMKWCPHARVATYATDGDDGMTAANKTSGGAIRDGARCIGSECMSWRVWDLYRARVQGTSGQDFISNDARSYEYKDSPWVVTYLPYEGGYCGLAGPEGHITP
jgi:hypothetical protein